MRPIAKKLGLSMKKLNIFYPSNNIIEILSLDGSSMRKFHVIIIDRTISYKE